MSNIVTVAGQDPRGLLERLSSGKAVTLAAADGRLLF